MVEKFNKLLNSEYRDILKNISWLFSDKILRMGVGLLLGVWTARYLGPANFGIWNYCIALTAIYSAISSLGLDSLLVQDLVKKGPEKTILGTSLILRLGGSTIALILSCLTIFFSDRQDSNLQLIVLIISLSFYFQAFDVIDLYFQSKTKSKYVVIAKNTVFLLCALFRILILYLKAGLIWFVLLSTIEIALSAFALVFYYKKKASISIFSWTFSKVYAIEKLKACWPIILSGVIVIIYMRVDQIMINQFLDKKSVGVYSAAVRIVEVWYFIPSAITVSLFPKLVKRKEENAGYYESILVMFKILFWVSFSISILVTFISEPLISILFGKAYIQAAFVLKISIWTGIFVFWGVGAANILIIEDLNKHNLYKSVSSLLMNIILNVVLIPKYGIDGAAIATLISQAYGSYFYYLIPQKTRHIFYLQTKSMMYGKF